MLKVKDGRPENKRVLSCLVRDLGDDLLGLGAVPKRNANANDGLSTVAVLVGKMTCRQCVCLYGVHYRILPDACLAP